MEAQFKYLEYLSPESMYYKKPKVSDVEEFYVEDLDKNWFINKNDLFWTMYSIPENEMITQGFKIHVSTVYEEAQQTLNIVSKLLIKLNIPFKHVNNKRSLLSMYSKHGSRISAGKFITIYPCQEEFLPTLEELYISLKDFEKGPYILTDKQYKNSNIYYRYGAFKKIEDKDGQLCIADPEDNLIPDVRAAKFSLPEFVTLPIELQQSDTIKNTLPVESPLKKYKIQNRKSYKIF